MRFARPAALLPGQPPIYTGVAETAVYVATDHRGRGVGKVLLYKQVTEADTAGL